MIARYRVLKTRNRNTGQWETSGAVYERTFGSPEKAVIPVVGAGDVKVDWQEWDDIAQREREYGFYEPSLEEYDKVFAVHANRYRLSQRIYTIEGQSYKEISTQLYERYVLSSKQAESVSKQASPPVTYEPILAEGRALREGDADEQSD